MGETTTVDKQNSNLTAAGELETTSESGVSFAAPNYSVTSGEDEDSKSGEFGDTDNQVATDSGRVVNNPNFDKATTRDAVMDATFVGAGDIDLRNAMTAIQGTHAEDGTFTEASGEELEVALATIARVRDLTIEQCREQYTTAMQIKREGEAKALANGGDTGSKGVSPTLDVAKHPEFMGSTGQLRFGMIMGDVFGVDPVFGSLISPTGGGVGPGNDSVTDADPNNPVAAHGTAHDAAGYFFNGHGIGPGYNYLGEWDPFDTDNEKSGQYGGTAYFAERDPILNGIATIGTILSNYEDGFNSENIVNSSVEVGEGNLMTELVDDPIGLAKRGISAGWEGAKGLASDAWQGAKGLAGDAWSGAKGLASDAWSGTKDAASNAWEGTKDAASSAWSGLSGWASDKWSGAKGLASDAWSGTKDAASNAWEGTKDTASSAWDSASGWAGDTWDSASSTAGQAWDSTTDAAGAAWDGVSGAASDTWGGITDAWDRIPSRQQNQHDYGTSPTGDGVSGPTAFWDTQDAGVQGGFEGASLSAPGNTTRALYGGITAGQTPTDSGGTQYGLSANVGVANNSASIPDIINSFAPGTVPEGLIAQLDTGLGTASADAWVSDQGLSIGAQANLAEIALTLGTQGTGNQDRTVRGGLSEGVGAAARLHWGDADGDQLPEYGIGGDFLFFSADIKTEDPVRDIIAASLPGGNLLLDRILPTQNLTQDTKEAVSAGASAAADWAGHAWDSTKETAGAAWDTTTEAASQVQDVMSTAWDTGTATVSSAANTLQGVASDAWDQTTSLVSTATSTVGNVASNAWDQGTSMASSAASTIGGVASDAWDQGTSMASNAASTVGNVASSALSTAGNVASSAASTVGNAASSAWDGASSMASSAGDSISSAWSSLWD